MGFTSGNDGEIVVWGDNSAGQMDALTTRLFPSDFSTIARGGRTQCLAIRQDGTLTLWGTGPVPQPTYALGDRFTDAAISVSFAVAIVRADNSVKGWGKFADTPPTSAEQPPVLSASAITVGGGHCLVIETGSQKLRTWGPAAVAAVPPPPGKFVRIAARHDYNMALREDGTLFGWGGNIFTPPHMHVASAPHVHPSLADWTFANGYYSHPPDSFIEIAAGSRQDDLSFPVSHVLALRSNGSVAGWGANTFGETKAPKDMKFSSIAAGRGFSVGLDTDGFIHHWGAASMLADVPRGPFVSIGAGTVHALAVRGHRIRADRDR